MNFQFILIDGLNFCHRFFHTMRNMSDSKGRPTGMLYGVLNNIYYLQKNNPKAKIVFLWDSPRLKRKAANQDYKADRARKDDSIYAQVEELKHFLRLWGVKQAVAFGYEADDLAGRLVHKNPNKKILLVSNDCDWYMYSRDNVFIQKKIKKEDRLLSKKDILDIIELEDIDYYKLFLSIVGTHNNVQGIKGIRKEPVRSLCNFTKGNIEELFSTKTIDKKLVTALKRIKENESLIRDNSSLIEPAIKGYTPEIDKGSRNEVGFFRRLNEYEMVGLVKKYMEWLSR